MHCPRCGHTAFSVSSPCPACGFAGEAGLLEMLAHLDFILNELPVWEHVPIQTRERLGQHYRWRRLQVEIALGLRHPPLDAESARQSRLQLLLLRALGSAVSNWIPRGWITAETSQEVQSQVAAWTQAIRERLRDAPTTADPPAEQVQLERARYLLATLEHLHGTGRLAEDAYPEARALLNADVERAEVAAGLRGPAVPAYTAPARQPEPPPPGPLPAAPPLPSRPPRRPLTWDRAWETLLSERTLRALLFLGAALLFAAAVSLVVWNWEAFPPWLQVTLLALFTAAFYALGWYVRTRMRLYGSGMALSAVAALLVPLDFYAFYLSGGFPRERWPEVWLAASLVCAAAYVLTALLLQAEFFGYLVGAATGSVLAAALKVSGVDTRWWQAALAGLAFVLALSGEGLLRSRERWRVLAVPLWRVALAGTAVILPVALGWGLVRQAGDQTFATALAIAWWLGGLTSVLGAWRYRFPFVGGIAAAIFPVALWLAQRAVFLHWGVRPAWHALGWALLVPLYLVIGRALRRSREKAVQSYGFLVTAGAVALALLAAGRSVADSTVAGIVYLLLAGATAVAVWLWRRPWLLPLASVSLLAAAAAWLARWEATLAQLGLAWGLLAIVHVGAAILLRRIPGGGGEARPHGRRPWPQFYDAPVYLAGWVIAGLALLPPLALWDKAIVSYTLGNWMALSGWLVLLLQGNEAPGLAALLTLRRWPVTLFQWATALLLLPWVWMLWIVRRPPDARLGLAYILVVGGLLGIGCWLRRFRWGNGLPWHVAAHLGAGTAMVTALAYYDQKWAALVLLLAAGFYFAAARLMHGRGWLIPAGLALSAGWVLGLDWLGLERDPLGLMAAFLVLVCLAGAALLERFQLATRRFLLPFYAVMQGVGGAAVLGEVLLLLLWERTDAALLWAASALVLLAVGAALCAWLFGTQAHGHVAAWLGLAAGALVASAYSQGRGSSAAKVALLAAVYVLGERALRWLSLQKKPHPAAEAQTSAPEQAGPRPGVPALWLFDAVRRAWRLFRRPLLVAGWSASLFAIGLALGRNLVLLGGGPLRETWAIVGLAMVTVLYALAAWLFRRRQFLWDAGILAFFPWTLLTHRGWYLWRPPNLGDAVFYDFPKAWAVLALVGLLVGLLLAARTTGRGPAWLAGRKGTWPAGRGSWGTPLQVLAHLLLPWSLFWGIFDVDTALVVFGLGIVFYLVAVWADRWQGPAAGSPRRATFLYPVAALVPIWALYLLAHFVSSPPRTTCGLVLLGFALPALFLGRWLARRERGYGLPLYLAAYAWAAIGTLLVSSDRPWLIAALLLDTLLAALATWTFRQPLWIVPASGTLAWALGLALAEWHVPVKRYGWGLIALAGVYLLVAHVLRRWAGRRGPVGARHFLLGPVAVPPAGIDSETQREQPGAGNASPLQYAAPILICGALLSMTGLVFSSLDSLGALVGYGAAAALYALAAVLLRSPVLLTPASILAAVAYGAAMRELKVPRLDYGPALWPGIADALLLAYLVDRKWGRLAGPPDEAATPSSVLERLLLAMQRWWALPLYVAGSTGAALAAALSLNDEARLTLALLGAAVVYGLATWRFRQRWWLFVAVGTGQLAALAAIHWLGWADPPGTAALAFAPVTWGTAVAGLLVARKRGEGAPLGRKWQDWRAGWSRPLYLLLLCDVVIGQAVVTNLAWWANGWVSVWHTLLLAVLTTVWMAPALGYVTAGLGLLALVQRLDWMHVDALNWPWALALLATAYGLVGYLLRYLRLRGSALSEQDLVWETPLRRSGWVLSGGTLLLTLLLGISVLSLVVRVTLGLQLVRPAELPRVEMVVSVLAILGLFYLAAAVTDRWRWVGYMAAAMLLSAWSLQWLLVWEMREVQWYAVPAGLYLLAVGYLEWRNGQRPWARWIDWAALLLLFGSSFRQSLGDRGWLYAFVMGGEGLAVLWWGSARRMRRFLYAGVGAVIIDVVAQLINQLASVNRWIVFGVVGLLLLALGILIERRLGWVKELRVRLEDWE